MRPTRSFFLACVALALLTACSSSGVVPGMGGSAASQVVAEVNGRSVTLAELDERIAPQLYEARSEALESWMRELVIEMEAEKRGISPEDLLDREVAAIGDVTDGDIQSFFEENRERMRPGETLENVSPQIRRYLEQQRRSEAVASIFDGANVSLKLEPPRIEIDATGPSRGPEDAPVTIVEFSDYQCPFCSRAEPVVKQVLERYPTKVRVVYRHFPLDSLHPQARGAAIAAVCAEEQDQFWAFHEKVFANQRALEPENLTRFAEEIGLDLAAFASCQEGPVASSRVAEDVRAGQAAGTTGTPAFYVNGIKLSGARPLEDFVEVIERELERKGDGA